MAARFWDKPPPSWPNFCAAALCAGVAFGSAIGGHWWPALANALMAAINYVVADVLRRAR